MSGTPKWDWLKEKVAEAIINSVVLGVVMLVGYGILQAFIGDLKLDKTGEKIRKEMVDKHNESIARESELLGQISELKKEMEKHVKQAPNPPEALFAPSLVPDDSLPNPAQQRLDFEKKHRLPYYKD